MVDAGPSAGAKVDADRRQGRNLARMLFRLRATSPLDRGRFEVKLVPTCRPRPSVSADGSLTFCLHDDIFLSGPGKAEVREPCYSACGLG